MSTNVNSLFAQAKQEDTLSPAGANLLQSPDLGAVIQAGLGTNVDDISSSSPILVTFLLDDSSSIASGNNEAVIRSGVNMVIDALNDTKSLERDGILVYAGVLNSKVPISPYVILPNAVRLDSNNFIASGGTPLYDRTIETLGLVLAKAQEFTNAGVACRTITLIVTDGADYGSHKRAKDVAPLVKDLLRQEMHIVCAMGINDGSTDFTKVFTDMGIDPKWILTPGKTPSEIRKAFALVSQSTVRVSQTGGAQYSQVGGFATP